VGTNARIIRYNGTGWANDPSGTSADMNDVACVSATDCWAAGDRQGGDLTFDHRGTVSWVETLLNPPGSAQNLDGIACVASNDCWAVGRQNGTSYTFVRWNGSVWTQQLVAGGDDLNDVACADTANCWAVGRGGRSMRWDGSTWTADPSGTTRELEGVYFLPGGGGSVALRSWRECIEPISTNCP
jgi:hypothetical protein